MNIMFRIITGIGLLALGYYVGKEIGKTDDLRKELDEKRNNSENNNQTSDNESE